ncbi:GGDEF domain-containing protein, partial [Paenibacillus sepulcri]|nr:GGDEF domain-containing protein [Paenibacillus sepulcri]
IIELPPLVDVGDRRIAIEYKRISSTGSGLAEDRLIMLIMTDVTARLATEERIRYLSSHDSLTSLHNRSYMEPLLDKMPRSDQFPVSVVVIDMNGLKLSNDVFGHRAGDNL